MIPGENQGVCKELILQGEIVVKFKEDKIHIKITTKI